MCREQFPALPGPWPNPRPVTSRTHGPPSWGQMRQENGDGTSNKLTFSTHPEDYGITFYLTFFLEEISLSKYRLYITVSMKMTIIFSTGLFL